MFCNLNLILSISNILNSMCELHLSANTPCTLWENVCVRSTTCVNMFVKTFLLQRCVIMVICCLFFRNCKAFDFLLDNNNKVEKNNTHHLKKLIIIMLLQGPSYNYFNVNWKPLCHSLNVHVFL